MCTLLRIWHRGRCGRHTWLGCGSTPDKELHVTKRTLQIFQNLEHQAEFHIASIEGCKRATKGNEYRVLIRWMGLDDDEATQESVSRVLEDGPVILKKELKRLRLSTEDRRRLRERYGFSV